MALLFTAELTCLVSCVNYVHFSASRSQKILQGSLTQLYYDWRAFFKAVVQLYPLSLLLVQEGKAQNSETTSRPF